MSGERHPADDDEVHVSVVEGLQQRAEVEGGHSVAAPAIAVICLERR
jgi:hypothetical protein